MTTLFGYTYRWLVLLALAVLLSGCKQNSGDPATVQGYVEGEFVYVAAPLSGKLDKLFARRGMLVKAGDPLFELESVPERSARDEVKQRLRQTQAQLADARKGKRPAELDAATAQLSQARAALAFSEQELVRNERLLQANVVPRQEVERLRTRRDQDRQRVVQLEAELATARLGSRSDQVAAAQASADALSASVARSEWEVGQKRQAAPVAGLVFDVLFREGEWLAGGRPAVVLLPPGNITVRAFVPQQLLAGIRQGDPARITIDGRPPCSGRVSFISPRAEFTPPVIYSRESRTKLVYLVELSVDPAVAAALHPGQPVDVRFGSGS